MTRFALRRGLRKPFSRNLKGALLPCLERCRWNLLPLTPTWRWVPSFEP